MTGDELRALAIDLAVEVRWRLIVRCY